MTTALEIASLAVLLCYYVVTYAKVRRRPEHLPVVVRFQPAERLSPALARYIWKGCVDQRTVASVFAQLAVKGLIHIAPGPKGSYQITRTKPSGPLPPTSREEQVALDWLFSNFLTENTFKPQHDSEGCVSALTGAVTRQAGALYYATHYGYVALGTLLALLCTFAIASSITAADRGGVFILSWAVFMTTFLAVIVTWKTLISSVLDLFKEIGDWSRVVAGVLVSALTWTALVGVSDRLAQLATRQYVGCVIVLAALNPFVSLFLKNITERGEELKWQLEGFREFLLAAEQDRLDRMNMPKEALRSTEQNLAYAIALEVKEGWGDELANACHPQIA